MSYWREAVVERPPDFAKWKRQVHKHIGDVLSIHNNADRKRAIEQTLEFLSLYVNAFRAMLRPERKPASPLKWQTQAIRSLRNNRQRYRAKNLFRLDGYIRTHHERWPIGAPNRTPTKFVPDYDAIRKAIGLTQRMTQAYLKELVERGIWTVYERKAHGRIIYQVGEWRYWKDDESRETGVRKHLFLTEKTWRKAMKG